MRITTVLNKLLAIQGLWVRGVQLWLVAGCWVLFVVPRWHVSRCSGCGQEVRQRYDRSWRSWHHVDTFGLKTNLRYAIWRVQCPRCGVRTEVVPWAAWGSCFTRDFEQQVAWMAQRCDLTAVAEYYRISWATVRNIILSIP